MVKFPIFLFKINYFPEQGWYLQTILFSFCFLFLTQRKYRILVLEHRPGYDVNIVEISALRFFIICSHSHDIIFQPPPHHTIQMAMLRNGIGEEKGKPGASLSNRREHTLVSFFGCCICISGWV